MRLNNSENIVFSSCRLSLCFVVLYIMHNIHVAVSIHWLHDIYFNSEKHYYAFAIVV